MSASSSWCCTLPLIRSFYYSLGQFPLIERTDKQSLRSNAIAHRQVLNCLLCSRRTFGNLLAYQAQSLLDVSRALLSNSDAHHLCKIQWNMTLTILSGYIALCVELKFPRNGRMLILILTRTFNSTCASFDRAFVYWFETHWSISFLWCAFESWSMAVSAWMSHDRYKFRE